jgi:hypothetical protein
LRAAAKLDELDRVLDRDDVLVARLVDLVDHRRERRRLARAGGAGDEHESTRAPRQLVHDGRQSELVDRDELAGNQAERGRDRAALEVRVDAEPRAAGDGVGEIELQIGLQPASLVGREDRVDELPRVLGRELRVALEGAQPSALAQHRRHAGRQMQIGRVALHDCKQDV